jgi:hypothetical protein
LAGLFSAVDFKSRKADGVVRLAVRPSCSATPGNDTQRVSAWGIGAAPHLYGHDGTDLCNILSSFKALAKAALHQLSRVMRLAGKPDGIHGGEVARASYASKLI